MIDCLHILLEADVDQIQFPRAAVQNTRTHVRTRRMLHTPLRCCWGVVLAFDASKNKKQRHLGQAWNNNHNALSHRDTNWKMNQHMRVIRLALVHFRNVYLTVKSRGISRLLTRSKTMIFSQGVILISMLLIWFILAKLLYRPEQASFQAGEYHCWQEIWKLLLCCY